MRSIRFCARVSAAGAALLAACLSCAGPAIAASLPEIRLSSANAVPACVTPDRLMRYLTQRNAKLADRYRDIAHHYKAHGEATRVRWDYAFFQMLLETNSLRYGGDDRPRQNNFAGIGTTGGGVRGNSFPDVSSGVLAQMQHLVAYSGERVDKPVAPRTAENQGAIIERSNRLGRAVRFSDLQQRWAMDRRYAEKINILASAFFDTYCRGRENEVEEARSPAQLPQPVAVHTGHLARMDD